MTSFVSYGQSASEPTIVKPTPGGRRQAPVAPPTDYHPADNLDMTLGGLNPVLAAAGPLLGLARRLRFSAGQSNMDALRERIITEIKAFEKRVQTASIPNEDARAAHYALCAAIDDIVLNTPWGGNSAWARNGMVSTFHIGVTGGERFFDLLNHLLKDPGAHGDVLELMYLCLSLGFEGRLRILPQGAIEHARIRDGLYRVLAERRGDFERELSPHWQGVAAPYRPLRPSIEFWTVMAVMLILITIMATGFSFALNGSSDATLAQLATLAPTGDATISIAAPTPPPPPPKPTVFDHLRSFLAPEIGKGLVAVVPAGPDVIIRVNNAGMFDPGAATVDDSDVPLLDRIGAALEGEPGKIVITGHTDNVPIRTIRFPSNWNLSQARADAVAAIISGLLADKSRVSSQGLADTQPIASNDTPEGREANRRIDITLSVPAETAAP
jgi:type VI secretion system protein ImpK